MDAEINYQQKKEEMTQKMDQIEQKRNVIMEEKTKEVIDKIDDQGKRKELEE